MLPEIVSETKKNSTRQLKKASGNSTQETINAIPEPTQIIKLAGYFQLLDRKTSRYIDNCYHLEKCLAFLPILSKFEPI